MVGIVTRYRKHDFTFAALSVVRRLDELGRSSRIICYDWRSPHIDPAWDNKVKHSAFRQWLPSVSHIVWTSCVDEYFLDAARRRGIRNTLYTSWEQLETYDEKVVGGYTHILVPSLLQAMQIRDRFRLKNVAVMPYDCGMPITRKQSCVEPDKIRLFISLYGTQLRRVDISALMLLMDIVRDMPNVEVVVGCANGLAGHTTRELKDAARKYPSRWTVLWNCPWYEQAILMGSSDLTVWPARWDGLGLVGTTSLHMGTPVIAWDVPPINEYLSGGRNSILVPAPVEYNWLGVPAVKPDYNEFDRVLRWLIDRPDALAELRKHTNEHLATRRQEFRKGWDVILPAAL